MAAKRRRGGRARGEGVEVGVERERGRGVVFGGLIVGYLFLAGTGAGAFAVAAGACLWDAWRPTSRTRVVVHGVQPALALAPLVVMAAALMLLADLGSLDAAARVLIQPPRTVMAVGAWLVVALIATSGAVAVMGFVPRLRTPSAAWGCVIAGLVAAVGVMAYSALLLADAVAVDFWRTPWLTVLFAASSLSCGTALAVAAAVLAPAPGLDERTREAAAGALWHLGRTLAYVELVALALFLVSRGLSTEWARASCALLLTGALAPVFWSGVVGAGIAVPLGLHGAGRRIGRARSAAMLASACGVLVGGLALRWCVVAAAVMAPLVLSFV